MLSAGFGEIEAGRELEARARARRRSRARLARLRPERQRHRRGRRPAPRCGATRCRALRAGRRGDGLAERQRRRQRARLAPRDRLPHRRLDRQPGRARRQRLARGARRARRASRSVAMFLESDGDGASARRRRWRCCAERGIGVAVLKVGASEAGAARRGRAHRRARRRPAGLPGAGRGGGRRLGRATRTSCSSSPACWPSRARGRAATAGSPILTCSGGDSGIAADEAERIGLELPPRSAARPASGSRSCCPTAATIGNPLDYTSMIWAETDRLRRIVATVGADPAIDQLLLFYDHPQGLAPEHEPSWARRRARRSPPAPRETRRRVAVRLHPPRPDRARRHPRARRPRRAGGRRADAPRSLCAAALRRPPGDPAAAARDRRGGGRRRAVRGDGRRLARRGRGEGAAAGRRGRGSGRRRGRRRRSARSQPPAELGWPVAVKLSGPRLRHKSDVGATRARARRRRGAARRRGAPARPARRPPAPSCWSSGWRAPGRRAAGRRARRRGRPGARASALGGIWAEALDDVAIVPLPASPSGSSGRSARCAAPRLLDRRPRRAAGRPGRGRRGGRSRAGELLARSGLDLLELNPLIVGPAGCGRARRPRPAQRSSRSGRDDRDRQPLDSVDPADALQLGLAGRLDPLDAAGDERERLGDLGPGQVAADAEVDPGAERQGPGLVPLDGDVEAVRRRRTPRDPGSPVNAQTDTTVPAGKSTPS